MDIILKGKELMSNCDYLRSFESMGKGLLLVRIDNRGKGDTPNHFFFENGYKPPLDVAVNNKSGEIEYIKFFLQDEMVEKVQIPKMTFVEDKGILYQDTSFNNDNFQCFFELNFRVIFDQNNLCVINDDFSVVSGYSLSEEIYILLSDNNFAGFLLRSLNEKEIKEMVKSEII